MYVQLCFLNAEKLKVNKYFCIISTFHIKVLGSKGCLQSM